jgi:hypothetical protein
MGKSAWVHQQVADSVLKNGICRQPDRVADPLDYTKLVHLGIGESLSDPACCRVPPSHATSSEPAPPAFGVFPL